MKKQKDYTLLAMFIPFAIVVLFNIGLSCEIKKENKPAPMETGSDYQIYIESDDSLGIYDGKRHVKTIFFTDDSEIGRAIMDDNQ